VLLTGVCATLQPAHLGPLSAAVAVMIVPASGSTFAGTRPTGVAGLG
jgi:hypothetical protein